ncbi:MAG TPA: VWD domain-containing protein [Gaiellaceae bacterium]|nr:VWD domain-containing protein [Gaiellaceae bacterium]
MRRALTEDAWQHALDGIGANGAVSRKVALDLFALAYGPVPGTRRPPGKDSVGGVDGTLPAELILGFWPGLTAAQRATAARALGVTGVAPGGRRRMPARAGRMALRSDDPTAGDPNFKPNALIQSLAESWVKVYEAKLGPLRLKILAGTTTAANPDDANAATVPVDANGRVLRSLPEDGSGYCWIRVFPLGLQGTPFVRFSLAHEVFHCFEDDLLLEARRFPLMLPWLTEGAAVYASLAVDSPPWNPVDVRWRPGLAWFNEYLNTCTTPLFQRSYDAAGFFAHAQDASGSFWKDIPAALVLAGIGGSEGGFAGAGGPGKARLDSWGSSVYLKGTRGFDWTATAPVAPPSSASCPDTPIGGDADVRAAPYTLSPYTISPGAESAERPLLHVQISGHARLADGQIDTTALDDAWFCVGQRCECAPGQEGTPPPAPRLTLPADLALTGASTGARGSVTLESLERYCKQRQKPPPPPPTLPPLGCGNGCGTSYGDPHLVTPDNRAYDFQLAGEFTLVKSTSDDLEIQVRQQPYPGQGPVSVNTAFAARVAGDRVGFYPGDPVNVRVNGAGFEPTRAFRRLPHGGRIRLVYRQAELVWPDGSEAVVSLDGFGLHLLFVPAASRRGALTGLWGNFNGRASDDFATRNGRRLDERLVLASGHGPPHGQFRVFGDSWRISQRRSLFDYARGQTTRTFTIRNFPRTAAQQEALARRAAERAAEKVCRSAGIKDPRLLENCVLDLVTTGDNRFATAGATVQRLAGTFGTPPAGGGSSAITRWASILNGGPVSVVPSLLVDGETAVVADTPDRSTAEAASFTPSTSTDAPGLRRTTIIKLAAGAGLTDPVLLPRAGGGVQVMLSIPGQGASFAARNPDGSFARPVQATTDFHAAGGNPAILGPDGSPIWASAGSLQLYLSSGATAAVSKSLQNSVPGGGIPFNPSVGRNRAGRYWLAWSQRGGTAPPGLYMLPFDPASLNATGPPQHAPGSTETGSGRLSLACAASCRLVYFSGLDQIASWTYGEKSASAVAAIPKVALGAALTASYTKSGRLWATWWNYTAHRFETKLGDSTGHGGQTIPIGHPAGKSTVPGPLVGAIAGSDLALVSNWGTGLTHYYRYVNVIPPPA